MVYFHIFTYKNIQNRNPVLGLSAGAFSRRMKRNVVSAKVSLLVWLSEATVLMTLIPPDKYFDVIYLVLNAGVTPLIYYKGISTQPV